MYLRSRGACRHLRRTAGSLALFLAVVLSACGALSGSARPSPTASAQVETVTAPTNPGAVRAGVLSLIPVASGIRQPVYLTHAGDGSGRLFVLERSGRIRIIQNGQVLPEPFLDVSHLVTTSGSEQGLLGLAFHPRYRENGQFFIYYTAMDSANTVARYQVSSAPDVADPNSGSVLVSIPDTRSNHNGGMVVFGPDGYLYIGTGDGGGAGDPERNGQNPGALLGKLLRIDVDNRDDSLPYGIPPTNPFVDRNGARGEVWAYGLRNPWRFTFDRLTQDVYIADVGQGDYEEIHVQPAGSVGGENYGWNIMEGAHCYPASARCSTEGLVLPIIEYSHANGDCSITGGYVYRGSHSPSLVGTYVFGDFCSGRVWTAQRDSSGQWGVTLALDTNHSISSFGEDETGEIYMLSLAGGIYRVASAS